MPNTPNKFSTSAAKTPENVRQFIITPAAGKRLIGKALASHPVVQMALQSQTIVIIAGTTNGYVVEEIFATLDRKGDFPRRRFFRGVTLPPTRATTDTGRIPDESEFPGDVVLEQGVWQKGKTVFDVLDDLKEGDLILKGANALDLAQKRAAVLVGHPQAGTIGAALQAVVGRRVQLIVPVGVEKRVPGTLDDLAMLLNMPGAHGLRLFPAPGLVFTEIDAVELLTGARADIMAAGGICGAEGSVWLAVSGTTEQVDKANQLLKSVGSETSFEF